MLTIYTRNHVSMVYHFAAIHYSQFMVRVILFRILNVLCFYIITGQYVCSAQYGCFFYSSVISCFPCLLKYCLNDMEMVPVAPIITGGTFVISHSLYAVSV